MSARLKRNVGGLLVAARRLLVGARTGSTMTTRRRALGERRALEAAIAAIVLAVLPNVACNPLYVCDRNVTPKLLPDGESAIFFRSWCRSNFPNFLSGTFVRSELVSLSISAKHYTTLPQLPNGPNLAGIIGDVGVSPDGRFVAIIGIFDSFDDDAHRRRRLVLYDLQSRVPTEIDVSILGGDGLSYIAGPDLAQDAAVIVFGYYLDGAERVFAYTRADESFEEVSLDDGGERLGVSSRPRISNDGRLVAFESHRSVSISNVPETQVYVRDRLTGTTRLVSTNEQGQLAERHGTDLLAFSGNGRFVAFGFYVDDGESIGIEEPHGGCCYGVFLADLASGTVSPAAALHNRMFEGGAISDDGEYLVFSGNPHDDYDQWEDVLLYRHSTGLVERITDRVDAIDDRYGSGLASLSSDGAILLFRSDGWYLYNTANGKFERIEINEVG